jgi:trans-aconitate methyltransferase
MERIVETELMEEQAGAEGYAGADFEEAHSRVIELFDAVFPGIDIAGAVLDLGCGPGDVTFRFAHRFPAADLVAVDGSAAMIALARKRRQLSPVTGARISFVEAPLASGLVPRRTYAAIISTSCLHHLHDPCMLWHTIAGHAVSGTSIFVYDLRRPGDRETAAEMVEYYAGNEPEVLKRDFYNSLLAAFEPAEVALQLEHCGLGELSVRAVSDRHMIIFGHKV